MPPGVLLAQREKGKEFEKTMVVKAQDLEDAQKTHQVWSTYFDHRKQTSEGVILFFF